MTVSYTATVANASTNFGCFTKILLRWRGSVYKLIFKELLAYICLYFLLNLLYRSVLRQPGYEVERNFFEALVAFCRIQVSSIPMTFGLGFYVTLVVRRWWEQYTFLPWPDSMAILVSANLRGLCERSRIMRRTIMRYIILAYVFTLRRISYRVLKRFPTLDHLVEAGLMRPDEVKTIEAMNEFSSASKWWVPLTWAAAVVDEARLETKIGSDRACQTIMSEISNLRQGLTRVQHYDNISVPLVYTQVVTLAVYSYFVAAIFSSQWIVPINDEDYELMTNIPAFDLPMKQMFGNNSTSTDDDVMNGLTYQPLDLYMPIYLILKFMFYVGWLKVAETLINPFGEDDDDFEVNYLIDRHMQVSFMIVDMHKNYPNLERDAFWDQDTKMDLPYTEETEQYRKEEPKGSAEVQEEHDAESSIYYKLAYVFRSSGMHHNRHSSKVARKVSGLDESASEYENIDGSNVFGRKKGKARRSQMRRQQNHNSNEEFEDSENPQNRGKKSCSEASGFNGDIRRSTHSNRSIYAKMFGSRKDRKSRKYRKHENLNKKESDNDDQRETSDQHENDRLNILYGKLADIDDASSTNLATEDATVSDNPGIPEKSMTEVEQAMLKRDSMQDLDSSSNKDLSSRRNSRQSVPRDITNMTPSPTVPVIHVEKFPKEGKVEEAGKYEPVIFSPESVQSNLSTYSRNSSGRLKAKTSPNLARAVLTRGITKDLIAVEDAPQISPELPKGHPFLPDHLLHEDQNDSKESSPSSTSGINIFFGNRDHEEDVSDEFEKADSSDRTEEKRKEEDKKEQNVQTFNEATFYV